MSRRDRWRCCLTEDRVGGVIETGSIPCCRVDSAKVVLVFRSNHPALT